MGIQLRENIRYIVHLTEPVTNEQEIWVNTNEAAEITGYSREYLTKFAKKLFVKPETERELKVRKRLDRYEFWLPDLLIYQNTTGYGPRQNKN